MEAQPDGVIRENLIRDQRALESRRGSYGPLGSVAANGCGFAALYNLYVLLGRRPSPGRLLEEIRRNWLRTTLLCGLLGTSPWYVLRRLRALKGVRLSWYWNVGRRSVPERHELYFIFYIYGFGAHYAVAEQREGGIAVYNDCGGEGWKDYLKRAGAWWAAAVGIDRIPSG